MSKIISAMGAVNNAISNNEKLKFAKNNLNNELFQKIYKGYQKAKWSQLSLPIIFALVIIFELIFIPSQSVPNGYADFKTTLIIFEAVFFIIPIFPIWIVICDFTFGKDWRKYSKWYKKQTHPRELYRIFNIPENK